MCVSLSLYIYIHIYVHVCVYVCVCIYVYIYIRHVLSLSAEVHQAMTKYNPYRLAWKSNSFSDGHADIDCLIQIHACRFGWFKAS